MTAPMPRGTARDTSVNTIEHLTQTRPLEMQAIFDFNYGGENEGKKGKKDKRLPMNHGKTISNPLAVYTD